MSPCIGWCWAGLCLPCGWRQPLCVTLRKRSGISRDQLGRLHHWLLLTAWLVPASCPPAGSKPRGLHSRSSLCASAWCHCHTKGIGVPPALVTHGSSMPTLAGTHPACLDPMRLHTHMHKAISACVFQGRHMASVAYCMPLFCIMLDVCDASTATAGSGTRAWLPAPRTCLQAPCGAPWWQWQLTASSL